MRVSMIGYGTVGQGVADLLSRDSEMLARRAGESLDLAAIFVRNTDRPREIAPPDGAELTDDPERFFAIDSDVVIEVAGGADTPREYIERALQEGRDVVTANKAMLAKHGGSLFALAEKHKRRIGFEAAVAGGLPVVSTLTNGLLANRVESLVGILNGTCNFVLSQMLAQRVGYGATVAEAQRLGYAEADPTLDVSGRDAAEKLAILAALAFGGTVDPDAIATTGIEHLELEDLELAASFGYTIKPIAEARRVGEQVLMRCGPMLIRNDHPLAAVDGALNALIIDAHAAGPTTLVGLGAGRYPTASAVVGDVVALARLSRLREPAPLNPWPMEAESLALATPESIAEPAYLRLHVLHHEGAYEAVREHFAKRSIKVERLQETQGAIAMITERATHADLASAALDPIATAIAGEGRVLVPVHHPVSG